MKILALASALAIIVITTANYNWTSVDNAIEKAINQGIFTGCALGIATSNATILKKAYGTIGPKHGLYSPPVTLDMKFDLGYLTEPIGINSALMDMFDKNLLSSISKIAFIIQAFDNNGKRLLTIQNMLEHNSGLQATYNETYPATPADMLKNIYNMKLDYKTENNSVYSEIGLIVLGQVIAKVANKSLPDAFFQIMTIMGLRDTVYKPRTDKYKIVPSGFTGGQISWGTPYNKLAHFLNDTAGNAGLFSTVSDVMTYMQLLLNKGKMPEYFRVFSEDVVNKFLNVTKYRGYNNTRAFGWETIPAGTCPCGKKFSPSPNSFGLSDPPSGSFVWADKLKNVTIILLANGAFPSGQTMNPINYQAQISDAIMTTLGY